MSNKTFIYGCLIIILLQYIVIYILDSDTGALEEKIEQRDKTIKELVKELNEVYD